MATVLIVLAVLVVFDLAALAAGADSTERFGSPQWD
jgi:hypothetical protein